MTAADWDLEVVRAWLEDAAATLKRLPGYRPAAGRASWPGFVRDAAEAYGYGEVMIRPGPPPADAIDRLDAVLVWLTWVEEDDGRLLWAWANGVPWKALADRYARSVRWLRFRVTAALTVIVTRLRAGKGPMTGG